MPSTDEVTSLDWFPPRLVESSGVRVTPKQSAGLGLMPAAPL